ncbi:MAG TPA: hypothetical protein VL098_09770 [Flavipsychrobacter sp.]|nr:hypothetical protein [Flavipsychrobacter sp.]
MKILLIEDRLERKNQFLSIAGISSLDEYSFLTVLRPTELEALKSDIKNRNQTRLNEFDLLMIHKSAFSQSEQEIIRETSKPTVYFSGGIPQSSYTENPDTLHINSKEFYSSNLKNFLEAIAKTGKIELMRLQFGEQWQLNLLLNLRQEITQKINTELESGIFPEDFEALFTDKIMDFEWPTSMASRIENLKINGMAPNETILDDIKSVVTEMINQQLNIVS